MPPKRTHDEFVAKLTEINPNIDVLGTYVNSSTHIRCRCKKDGYEWYPSPNKLMMGRGCPRCAKKEPYVDSFLRRMASMHPDITVLSRFNRGDQKVLCRCNIDGHEWNATPYSLLKGSGCPKCAGKERLSQAEFMKRVNACGKPITVVGKYKNRNTKVLCRCDIDGYEWYASPGHLMNGVGCPECAGVLRKTKDTFVDEMRRIHPQIEVLGDYVNNRTKIQCRCSLCNTTWSASPNALLSHHSSCPACNQSSGEQKIYSILLSKGIEVILQYRFDDCRDMLSLPFDFYIPTSKVAIEYDGQQHFMPVDFGGRPRHVSEQNFEIVKQHDAIKNQYCDTHGITLIRIPYTEFDNIEQILDKHLL